MRYIKRFNESNDVRNYSVMALTNEEDSFCTVVKEWNEVKDGYDPTDVDAHWAKDSIDLPGFQYYDKNTDAFTSDPMDATHVWFTIKSRQGPPFHPRKS